MRFQNLTTSHFDNKRSGRSGCFRVSRLCTGRCSSYRPPLDGTTGKACANSELPTLQGACHASSSAYLVFSRNIFSYFNINFVLHEVEVFSKVIYFHLICVFELLRHCLSHEFAFLLNCLCWTLTHKQINYLNGRPNEPDPEPRPTWMWYGVLNLLRNCWCSVCELPRNSVDICFSENSFRFPVTMVHSGEGKSSIKDGIIDFTAGSLGEYESKTFNTLGAMQLYSCIRVSSKQKNTAWKALKVF